jgi:sugar transferase EpsL
VTVSTIVQQSIKRTVDIIASVVPLLLVSPLLLLVMLRIRTKMGSPVLFRHVRPGLHGRPFTVYKLRTMTDERDGHGKLLPPGQRLTRLGRFLRTTSLDELPQLWNVLRGEMSLVGPRPLLMEYLDRYTPEQARRHDVPPGITGWSQVNGRNAISWEERFRLDVWYVDHWSLWLDLRILALTVVKIVRREGVNFPDNAVSSPFMGSGRGKPQQSSEKPGAQG